MTFEKEILEQEERLTELYAKTKNTYCIKCGFRHPYCICGDKQ